MIQRIQTIWLLLAITAGVLSIKFPFYTGQLATTNVFLKLTAAENIPILLLTVLSVVTSAISIFLFKNRKKQTTICFLNLLLSIIIIVLYILQVKKFTTGSYSLTSLLAFSIPIWLILALAGIRKDEKIIRSLDRLR